MTVVEAGTVALVGDTWENLLYAPKRPLVVYLAGPFRPYVDDLGVRHTIASNVRRAGQKGIEIWRRGMVALVPHTLTYLDPKRQQQDGGIAGVAPEVFMDGELELIRRSDLLVLMPEWRYSKGAIAEKEFAEQIGIPVLEWMEFIDVTDAYGSSRMDESRSSGSTDARNGDVGNASGPIDDLARISCATGRGKGN